MNPPSLDMEKHFFAGFPSWITVSSPHIGIPWSVLGVFSIFSEVLRRNACSTFLWLLGGPPPSVKCRQRGPIWLQYSSFPMEITTTHGIGTKIAPRSQSKRVLTAISV